MNPKLDRRQIARLLGPHFPTMPATATSDDWHGFLDEITGLITPLDEPNATAFDNWRKALAAQGYPVWISQERADTIKARAAVLMAAEAKRLAGEEALMAKLRKDAPLVTAAELMRAAERKP